MSAQTSSAPGVRTKEFHFPLTVEWLGDRSVAVRVEGKTAVEIRPPLVFGGSDPSAWSPEDLLVAAAASCLAVTFTGLAARAGLEYARLSVAGDGVAGRRADGHFGFIGLRLQLSLETSTTEQAAARALAKQAEQSCLIAASLAVPVETEIEVTSPRTA
jgi:organic hydroperoxide reductase OsmC/OhrA